MNGRESEMNVNELRVGDRIRITGVPGEGIPGYGIQPETVRVYKKLLARNRPVRIYEINEYGQPWFQCKFKRRNGIWEEHTLAIFDDDTNWVPVKKRPGQK